MKQAWLLHQGFLDVQSVLPKQVTFQTAALMKYLLPPFLFPPLSPGFSSRINGNPAQLHFGNQQVSLVA